MKQVLEKLKKETVYQECFEEANIFEDGVSVALHITDKKKVTRVRVDDCLITSKKTKKCDYIAYHPSKDNVLLIELKSSKMKSDSVLNQFLDSLNFLKNKADGEYFETNCVCILVCRKPRKKMYDLRKNLKEKGLGYKIFYHDSVVKKTITNLF